MLAGLTSWGADPCAEPGQRQASTRASAWIRPQRLGAETPCPGASTRSPTQAAVPGDGARQPFSDLDASGLRPDGFTTIHGGTSTVDGQYRRRRRGESRSPDAFRRRQRLARSARGHYQTPERRCRASRRPPTPTAPTPTPRRPGARRRRAAPARPQPGPGGPLRHARRRSKSLGRPPSRRPLRVRVSFARTAPAKTAVIEVHPQPARDRPREDEGAARAGTDACASSSCREARGWLRSRSRAHRLKPSACAWAAGAALQVRDHPALARLDGARPPGYKVCDDDRAVLLAVVLLGALAPAAVGRPRSPGSSTGGGEPGRVPGAGLPARSTSATGGRRLRRDGRRAAQVRDRGALRRRRGDQARPPDAFRVFLGEVNQSDFRYADGQSSPPPRSTRTTPRMPASRPTMSRC